MASKMAPDYHFVTRWRVRGRCEEVYALLEDAPDLVRWWPAVYLEVVRTAEGDARGIGGEAELYTKGWLPYTLRWHSRVVASERPFGFTLEALGDLEGRGVWTFRQDGEFVEVGYDWRVRARKPLLRRFSFVLRPLFAANHRWAMARGEASLALELARRAAPDEPARARLPAPPGPTPTEPGAWLQHVLGWGPGPGRT